MESRWNGPAANAMCCADVSTVSENRKMVLLELLGWATYAESARISRVNETEYLFYEITTAYNNGWYRVACIILILKYNTFFKIARYDKLKFPCGFFPQVIETRNPTSCRIRR
jgi:hypothetical protein